MQLLTKDYKMNNINKSIKLNYKFSPQNKEELISIINKQIKNFGDNVNLNDIDISSVTSLSYLFYNSKFTGDISKWNVSNVTNMVSMFSHSKFNGNISEWDVSNVTTMQSMFYSSNFTGNISNWDVNNVKETQLMFAYSKFNGNISE